MPSKSTQVSLESLLAPARRSYRSAVVAAREELRALAAPSKGDLDPKVADPFASSYIDPSKLARMTPHQDHGQADTKRLTASLDVLSGLLDQGDALFTIEVPKGGDLLGLVQARLAEVGRAFAAARAASLAQAGMPSSSSEAGDMAAWPFIRWSLAERALAPSLLIKLHGEDFAAEGLAAFADGVFAMGFEVTGPSSPAPLVGLVRPGTFVVQASEAPKELAPDAPAFVAVFQDAPATTALFTHVPAATAVSGEGIYNRLEISRLPETSPTGPLGPKSVRQLQEELRQLAALAIEPNAAGEATAAAPADEATTSAAAATSASTDPIDRLAAWLLNRRQE